MAKKLGTIFYPAPVTSSCYSAYFQEDSSVYIQISEVGSGAKINPPSYILVSSSPGTNAIGKARVALIGTSYTNYKAALNSYITIGSAVSSVSQVNSITLTLGTGTSIMLNVVQSLASALFGSVYVRFNPVFIPNVIDIEISNRGQGELDEKQKVGTEILGGQEFNNSLNAYESTNGIVDNLSPIQSKILTKNILDKSTPKDRRNIIKSLVNHYSIAGKRI
jgi:hypothetical protein